jgi:phosphatidylinositol phospholipase C delta
MNLFQAKNLFVVEQLAAAQAKLAAEKQAFLEAEASSSSESSDDEEGGGTFKSLKDKWRKLRGKDPHATTAKPKVKMSLKLAALLVYTIGVKCHGIGEEGVAYAPEHIFSLSESSANKVLTASIDNLIKHNHTHLVRIYPKGTRVNSTNFEPHRYWAAGAQVVAINWQTFGTWIGCLRACFLIYLPICYRYGIRDESGHVPEEWSLGIRFETHSAATRPRRHAGETNAAFP